MSTILGIDPGSNISGYGIVKLEGKQAHYITSGCIKITNKTLANKLQTIYEGFSKIIETYQVDEVAVEEVFVHQNIQAALKLGQARGVAIVASTRHLCPLSEYSARKIKQTVVGYGAADKSQVQTMVKHLLHIKGQLQQDASDALAVALCHANHLLVKIPT